MAVAQEPAAAKGTLPVLEILAGAGPRFRSIDLRPSNGTGGSENRSFSTGAYADLGGTLLVRPAGRSSRSALQAIVIQGDGGVGLGLQAEPGDTGSLAEIRTWRALGQLGYLYPRKRLQVGGLVGGGIDTLTIDPNFVLPSIRYVYLRVGVTLSYTVIDNHLRIRVDGGFRKPFSLSDLDQAFGDQSTANGWDAVATVGGRLGIGFSYAVRFAYEGYRMNFSGTSADVPASGGPGGDGTDRALTLQFLIGWSI